jgi:hypothetical protein
MFDYTFGAFATIAALAVCCALPSAAPRAQGAPTPELTRCVDLRRIDHTEVVGDQYILFYMKDRTIYQNRLPQAFPALGRGRPFMYRVVTSQLCDGDLITVLEQWGFGFTPTESSPLGQFTSIDAAGVEALKEAAKSPRP